MAKLSIKVGSTSKLARIFVQDSSLTTGVGLTGLVYNTSSLQAYYIKEGQATATAITLATMTVGTWATGGFKVVDATNMPGVYEIGIPDAALSTGASTLIYIFGAANMTPVLLEIELTAVDNQSATAFMTSVASVTGAVASVTGAVGSVTGAVGSVTGNVGGNVVGSVASVTAAVKTTYAMHKNTALTAFMFVMTDSTTHLPQTGLTVTAQRSIDGAAFANCANAVSELANGVYKITLATTDLNGDVITLKFTATGGDATLITIITQT
jgi:hypothetical protein